MTVPSPPTDATELHSFPSRTVNADYPYSRLHNVAHEPEWFCGTGDCRFDLSEGKGNGTCYLAGHPLGAFVEKFGRLRAVPRSLTDQTALAQLRLASPVVVADLTDRSIVGQWHLTAELWGGDDYPRSQSWAERLHEAGFAGIWYPARHDVRGDLHSLALFGKVGYQPDALLRYSDDLIPQALIELAATEFGIEVIEPTAI